MASVDPKRADNTSLADLPPTTRQSWSALTVAAVTLVAFAGVAPVAGRPLAALNALFPSLDAIVFVTDLITSVLLFAQFSISRSRSLLVLGSGYLFTSMIVVPHALTFAGAFSPTGLLGANIQTGSWLFLFWHLGFTASLLAYALLRTETRAKLVSEASAPFAIGWCVAIVLGLTCSLTWLATGGASLLPPIILDQSRISPLVVYPVSLTMLTSAAALAVLFAGRRSMLDQWLMVVALVYILELAFSGLFPTVRFSLGFYAGRVFSLVTSSIVLIVFLGETMRLYARLAHSNVMLHREKDNKLMNLEAMAASIAHEVRQPLAAITVNGAAALRFLGRTPPDLGEVDAAVQAMVGDSFRASQILDNIRTLFGTAELKTEELDLNGLTLEVLRSVQSDLRNHEIKTSVALASKLPLVMGHKGQLQEVIINLVLNAMEAMGSVDGDRILKVGTELSAGDTITVTVEDTGPGLGAKEANSIFDPFVTTKPHGMGLGLAICRMIVERHQGQLSVSAAASRGAIFRVALPQASLVR